VPPRQNRAHLQRTTGLHHRTPSPQLTARPAPLAPSAPLRCASWPTRLGWKVRAGLELPACLLACCRVASPPARPLACPSPAPLSLARSPPPAATVAPTPLPVHPLHRFTLRLASALGQPPYQKPRACISAQIKI
jgi:hypothetical protein